LNLRIGIPWNTAGLIAVDLAHRQRESEFGALGLVAFAALEARAEEMQFGLGQRATCQVVRGPGGQSSRLPD